MLKTVFFLLVITAVLPLWSQVEPSASGGSYDLGSEHMMTPAPVNRRAYPTSTGSQERSNFVAGGLVFTAAGTDNLMLLGDQEKTPDATYSFLPTIELDRTTPRDEESISYDTGFTLYQIYSQLNSITQSATGNYKFHFTPYAVLSASDTFYQNYNTYNQGNPFSGNSVPGAPGSGAPGSSDILFVQPYGSQLTNSSSASLEYQYAKNSMIGASGLYSFLQISGTSYIPELGDQNTTSGNAFYSRRFGRSYAGVTYQFSKFVTHPYGSYTTSSTVFGFFSHYFTRTFSISVLGGPEYYAYWSESTPQKSSAWTPAVQGSIGWQVARANLAASYAHVVSGAGGLIGTFHSDTGGLSGQLELSRVWSMNGNVGVSHFANISSTPTQFAYYSGGTSIFCGVDFQRRIADSLSIGAGYQHLYQSYPGVTTNSLQNSNRGTISVRYNFNRPLGR